MKKFLSVIFAGIMLLMASVSSACFAYGDVSMPKNSTVHSYYTVIYGMKDKARAAKDNVKQLLNGSKKVTDFLPERTDKKTICKWGSNAGATLGLFAAGWLNGAVRNSMRLPAIVQYPGEYFNYMVSTESGNASGELVAAFIYCRLNNIPIDWRVCDFAGN